MKRLFAGTLSLAALVCAGSARAGVIELPDSAELGRDARQQPCMATRYWGDPEVSSPFVDSYALTCRGATGNRYLGVIRVAKDESELAKFRDKLQCGAASDVTVAEIGAARSRRCYDASIGFETIETTVHDGPHILVASVVSTAEGPAEEALRLILGRSAVDNERRNRASAASVATDSLAPAPQVSSATALVADSEAALEEGLRLIRQGLHMEASRVLNDAQGRLPPNTAIPTQVELLLMSGLADSNLGFFAEAERDFARADDLLSKNPNLPEAAVLIRKRQSYSALDLLNRRNFGNAVGMLDGLSSGQADPSQPLADLTTIRALNQSSKTDANSGMVATADVNALSQLVIDTQTAWARSVALLGQSKPAEAKAALDVADRSFAVLSGEPVNQQQLRWLGARIERQRARILARNDDWNGATTALDRAIAMLEAAGAAGTSFGPTLAETRLQRAAISAAGGDRSAALREFDQGIENLIASDARGAILPPSIEQYLDLLVADSKANPNGDATDKFFRAIQAVGDPEVARQVVQLQSAVTAGGNLTAKIQDRNEIETELTSLRFKIAGTPNDQPDAVKLLDARRAELESRLVQIENELAADPAFPAVSDAPVTVAELRKALLPGEAYFKVVQLRAYAFGFFADANGAQIYRVGRPLVELNPLIQVVRASIDGGATDKLPVFEVRGAYALWRLLAEPVADRLLAAKSVIVDPSGPLQMLPLGVLVTDQASVDAFAKSRTTAAYDYTNVNFLARQVSLSSALSPRSLLFSRTKAASEAPLPFIGFAEHLPAEVVARAGDQEISIGTGCLIERSEIARLTRLLRPIDKSELVRAGAALGLQQTPMVTDGAFTDTAVKARTDLDQFQVLHFATHGLTEGQWGCAKSPPALVTSLGADGSDALLSFEEIAKLHLNANLVVLSACDTAAGIKDEAVARAAGRETVGSSLEGLVRAFLAANARSVLTTYWPISDEGESEALIEDFYSAARSGTIGDALKTAQNALIAQPASSHPVFWGAFFVIGDAAKPLLTGQALASLAVAPPVELAQH